MIEQMLKLQSHELDDFLLLRTWLPPVIFDAHVHAALARAGVEIIDDLAATPGETFNYFDWPHHRRMFETTFPDQKYVAAVFGFPHLPNWEKDNSYISRLARRNSRIVPVFQAAFATNPLAVKNGLNHKFAGLKMYPTAKQKKTPTKIVEVFSKTVLEIANQLAKPIVVHLPNGLLADPEELIILARAYPRIRFVVAHMGVVYCYEPYFAKALESVKKQTNIFFDTAMVSDVRVIAKALEIVGPKRIIFGSDAPFSYFRGGYIINPIGQRRFYSQLKFNWVRDSDRQDYSDQINSLKLVHLNIILAIKQALEALALKSQNNAKVDIFYNNGRRLFKTKVR